MSVPKLSAEELVAKYAVTIYRAAFSHTQNKSDAEDITQEVFLKYIQNKKLFNDSEHEKAWLLTVTLNAAKSRMTSAFNRHRADLEDASEIANSENIEECSDRTSESEVINEAVSKLPENQRTAIHLFYYEDYDIKQICVVMNAKESTVKSWLKRARESLKKILREDYCYE